MTTSDYIVCEILGCGESDIEPLFGTLTDGDYFSDAVEFCKSEGIELWAGTVWEEAIRDAFRDVFGWEYEPETYFNFIDSHVSFDRETAESIDDFSGKSEKFLDLTGFEIELD